MRRLWGAMHMACAHTASVPVWLSSDFLAILSASLCGQSRCVSHSGMQASWGPRPTVSAPCPPSSSIGVSVQCRRCPAGPAGPARSRRSGSSETWWPRWPRPCRSCPPASGTHSPATSDVSVHPHQALEWRASQRSGHGAALCLCPPLLLVLCFVLCLGISSYCTGEKVAPPAPGGGHIQIEATPWGIDSPPIKKQQRNLPFCQV